MFEAGDGIAIKVCGVTNPEDALVCAGLDVAMLGLNFSPQSPRVISVTRAGEIMGAIRPRFPSVKFVGVFVDQEIDFVRATERDLALDAVQLHGDETAEYMRELEAPFVIKALRIRSTPADAMSFEGDAILLDAWNAVRRGGTGETFDWSIGAALRAQINRLILAGGLNAENVAEAIRIVRPDAVDVCSGVEEAPGRKSRSKLQRFVEATRQLPVVA